MAEIKNVLWAFLATMLFGLVSYVANVDNVHKNMEADTWKWSFSYDVGDVHLCGNATGNSFMYYFQQICRMGLMH